MGKLDCVRSCGRACADRFQGLSFLTGTVTVSGRYQHLKLRDQVALEELIGYRSSYAIQELLSHLCILMQKLDEFLLHFLSLTGPLVPAFGR